jgi:hypothetical protein
MSLLRVSLRIRDGRAVLLGWSVHTVLSKLTAVVMVFFQGPFQGPNALNIVLVLLMQMPSGRAVYIFRFYFFEC